MIAKMTSDKNQAYRLQVGAMDDNTLQAEMGQVAAELANIRAAMEELRQQAQELEEPDLSDVATALDFLSKPAVIDNEALQKARILEFNLAKRQAILNNEKRGRDRRAAYIAVAAHLRKNREVLEAAAAVVNDNLALSGRLAVPAQIDGRFPASVQQALKFADTFEK